MNFEYLRSCKSINSLSFFSEKYFKYSWTPGQLQEHIKDKNSYNFFCYLGDELVGYIFFSLNPFTQQAHLYQICVDPSFRNMQIAENLLKRAIFAMNDGLGTVYLEVDVLNYAAISFYSKLGFERLNKISSFYSDGSDAYAMHLNSSKLAKLQRY